MKNKLIYFVSFISLFFSFLFIDKAYALEINLDYRMNDNLTNKCSLIDSSYTLGGVVYTYDEVANQVVNTLKNNSFFMENYDIFVMVESCPVIYRDIEIKLFENKNTTKVLATPHTTDNYSLSFRINGNQNYFSYSIPYNTTQSLETILNKINYNSNYTYSNVSTRYSRDVSTKNTSSTGVLTFPDVNNQGFGGSSILLPYWTNFNFLNTLSNDDVYYITDDGKYPILLNSPIPNIYDVYYGNRPNLISSFGNNSYGVKSYNIDIQNSLGGSVNCTKDRSFNSLGFCEFLYSDLNTTNENNILSSDFDITFSFDKDSTHFPLLSDKYYILNFRALSDINLIPTIAMGYSGNVSIPIVIDDVIITNNGLYKDYQLILHTNNPDSNYSLNSIKIFNIPLSSYDSDIENFKLSIFNSYKYSQFDSYPTQEQINNNLNSNNLNSINNNINSNFFNNFSINDHGLSQFITLPLNFITHLNDSTCVPINIPYINNTYITLPCIYSIFDNKLHDVLVVYQTIMSGLICYYLGLNYFRIIKNAFSPDNDRIEVLDL